MSTWYPAPVLVRDRDAVNHRWPRRDHASDGMIGDAAHQNRPSDHNPDPTSKPPGVVRASDTDVDGIHRPTYVAGAILHPATRYVISNRRIMHVDRSFRPAVYTGDNPHTGHVHRSIRHGKENDTARLTFVQDVPTWHGIRKGARGSSARQLQAMLIGWGYTLTLDGVAGDVTIGALRKFQARTGLVVDGIAGPKTLNRMLGR